MKIVLFNVGHFHSPIYVGACLRLGHDIILHEDDLAVADLKAAKHKRPVVQGVEATLDRERPDFAICMAPNDQAAAVIDACVQRNIPLLAEKPGARTVAELAGAVERAEKQGLFAASAFCMRWHPAWARATEILPLLGKIGRIQLDYFAGPVARYGEMYSPWMADRKTTGGGCFLNLGVHAFDMLRHWGIDHPALAGKFFSHAWKQADYEDLGLVVLEHENTLIEIETGYCAVSPKAGFRGEIFGEKGNLSVSENHLRWVTSEGVIEATDYSAHEGAKQGGRGLMLEDLFECLASGRPPRTNLRDLLEALRFTDWCYGEESVGR